MKRFLISTFVLLLAGCATQGSRADNSKLDQLKPGVSTISDAESLLGKPQSVARHPDGSTTLGYSFSSVQTDAKSMIPVVGTFLGKGTTSNVEYTGLNFDRAGHYTNFSSYQHN